MWLLRREEGTENCVSKVNKFWDHFATTLSPLVWGDRALLYLTQIQWGWTFFTLSYPEVHSEHGVPVLFSETLTSYCDWASDCTRYNSFISFQANLKRPKTFKLLATNGIKSLLLSRPTRGKGKAKGLFATFRCCHWCCHATYHFFCGGFQFFFNKWVKLRGIR